MRARQLNLQCMRHTLFLTVLFTFAAATAAVAGAPKSGKTSAAVDSVAYPRMAPNNAYQTGEKLRYRLRYGMVVGAETEIAVPRETAMHGRPCYHIQFTARSLPFFDSFFKVDDQYETFIDKEGQFPHYFKQHVREGKYSRDDEVEFFHDKGIARSVIRNQEFPLDTYAQDIVSAYFFVRTLDLRSVKNGGTVSLKNFSDDKIYPLQVKILRRETIETDLGLFKTIVVEPLVQGAGLFKSEGKILVWMTDDDNKIPIKIAIKVAIGSINAEISQIEGARNPMKAKIED